VIRQLLASFAVAAVIILVAAAVLFATPVRACELLVASHYGAESGNRTANGERFDGSSMTAAHKTLPFGTRLRVSYGGRSVTVRINDRGPYVRGRQLDLSTAAARRLGMVRAGVAEVCVSRL
jgi:rare lipoprotein A